MRGGTPGSAFAKVTADGSPRTPGKARRWRYRCDEVGDGERAAPDFEGSGEETGADAEGTGLAVYLAFASSIFETSPWFCASSFKAFCQ